MAKTLVLGLTSAPWTQISATNSFSKKSDFVSYKIPWEAIITYKIRKKLMMQSRENHMRNLNDDRRTDRQTRVISYI